VIAEPPDDQPATGAPPAGDAPRVVVSLGTDHHRFDRLVAWIDAWTAEHPDVDVLVQRGTAREPATARSVDLLPYDDLVAAMVGADAVVVQGGPAGIVDARGAGHRPIVVPRRAGLGEHVDDHQVRFTRWMAERDQIDLAETVEELHHLIDARLADPASGRVVEVRDGSAAVDAFAAVVDPLLAGPTRRWRVSSRGGGSPSSG
jgi:UDP-N-acetylglucosamine transferase subunit ALG13